MHYLSPSARTRRTPFSDFVEKGGVRSYTVYNHMLLATSFKGIEEDYHHLTNHVQLWDVSAERQIVIKGSHAKQLLQLMTPRNLNKLTSKQALYAPIANDYGKIINDPIIIQKEEDEFYVSIASTDFHFFADGLRIGYKLDCEIYEAEIYPIAIQGPYADSLMEELTGHDMRNLPYFSSQTVSFGEKTFLVTKSGWSKQGGYEIYIDDINAGRNLWQKIMHIGKQYNIAIGCPNWIERIEGGLLSYGNDMTKDDSVLEAGLLKFTNLHDDIESLSQEVLRNELKKGSQKSLKRITVSKNIAPNDRPLVLMQKGKKVGYITSITPSKKYHGSVGYAMLYAPLSDLQNTFTSQWHQWDGKKTDHMVDFSCQIVRPNSVAK